MIRSVKDSIYHYKRLYRLMLPDDFSVQLTRELWNAWKEQGIEPPEWDATSKLYSEYENGFFYDVVKIAEGMEGAPLPVQYCAFCLDSYNTYAFSASDGYIVLMDEYFFQFVYVLCQVLMAHAQGVVQPCEEDMVRSYVRQMVVDNYINRRRFDFANDSLIVELMKRSNESATYANYLARSLQAFVLAHEIGHHVLGHTRGTRWEMFGMSTMSPQVIEVDDRRIEDEFAADNYGYRLFHRIIHTVDKDIQYAFFEYYYEYAPLLLFRIFYLLDQWTAHIKRKPVVYATHPHPLRRFEALQKEFAIDTTYPLYLDLMDAINMLQRE